MQINLTGRTAIVTGSTAGIGLAIAIGLARTGAHVVITGRTQARVDQAIAEVKTAAADAQVSGVAGDLGTREGAEHLIKLVPDADILINNLGIFQPTPFAEIPDADWMRFFETNVLSGVRLARHYFPQMLKANRGRILFISSESGLQIPAEMIHYGMTKTAQLAVSRGLAASLAGTGVTVNAVLPGPTRSEGVSDFFGQMAKDAGVSQAEMEKQFIAQHRPSSITRRLATVEEVANMVVYVCSPQASATTGAALRVDGGVVSTIG